MSKPICNPLRTKSRWFVVNTAPAQELRAAASLSRAGFGVYAPMRKIERHHRRTKVWSVAVRPLLPGYIFVEIPLVTEHRCRADRLSWFALRQSDGVKAILGADDGSGEEAPFPVLGRVVELLMAAQLNMDFDDTREAKIRRAEIGRTDRETAALYFPVGSTITAITGPLAQVGGEVVGVTGSGMVEALVAIFGRLSTVAFHVRDIELAAA